MGKKMTVSHANKQIRELSAEAAERRINSKRSFRFGLLTVVAFVGLILVEQTLARLGVFGDSISAADNATLVALMFVAFISVHFWVGYIRDNRRYKECENLIAAYQNQIDRS